MTDLFFYRDPTEEEKEETEDKSAFGAQGQQEGSWGNVGENWDQSTSESWANPTATESESWDAASAPTGNWDQEQ